MHTYLHKVWHFMLRRQKSPQTCLLTPETQNDSCLLSESSFQWNTWIMPYQVNCFVLRSKKQFTYRMIPVFHWNDDSGKRPESFWLSVSKQHNSNVLLERWYQQHLGILQLALALIFFYLHTTNSILVSQNTLLNCTQPALIFKSNQSFSNKISNVIWEYRLKCN